MFWVIPKLARTGQNPLPLATSRAFWLLNPPGALATSFILSTEAKRNKNNAAPRHMKEKNWFFDSVKSNNYCW